MLSVTYEWPSGRSEEWVVTQSADGTCALHRSRNHGQAEELIHGAADLASTLKVRPALRRLHRGRAAYYDVDGKDLTASDWVSLLRAPGGGEPEDPDVWDDDEREPWLASDEQVAELVPDADFVSRWARVNGHRVTLIRDGARVVPVLIDDDNEEVLGHELVRYQWFSEGGGGPISWDGGASMLLIGAGIGLSSTFGDEENYAELVDLPRSAGELGRRIARWITVVDADVSAAIALEPFDPRHTLSPEDRRGWLERLERLTTSTTVDLPIKTMPALRRELARTSWLYSQTKAALTAPLGAEGQALARVLARFAEDGVTGPLESGNWDLDDDADFGDQN